MKTQIAALVLFSVFLTTDSIAQEISHADSVYEEVEDMPQFPKGGEPGLLNYLKRKIKYPEAAYKNNITGTVYISFIINKEGYVKDAKIIKGVEAEINYEALRVIMEMPRWKPGKKNGRPVSVQYNIPIRFKIK